MLQFLEVTKSNKRETEECKCKLEATPMKLSEFPLVLLNQSSVNISPPMKLSSYTLIKDVIKQNGFYCYKDLLFYSI